MAVQKDGKIVVAGHEASFSPTAPVDAALARYNADGTLDTTFGVDGRVILRIGYYAAYSSLAIEPNGEIVVGGFAQLSPQQEVLAVVRYKPDGTGDATFGLGGEVLTNVGSNLQGSAGVAVEHNGDLVAASSIYIADNIFEVVVDRYLPGGASI